MPRATSTDKRLPPAVELDLLHRITRIIGSTLDLRTILREIVDLVAGLVKADACFIYLHEPAEKSLVLSASKTPHPREIEHLRLRVGEGLTGWVAEHKKPLALPEKAHEDQRFKFFHTLPEDTYEAFLSVPILIKDTVVGVINAQHKKPRIYTDQTIRLLTTISHQTAGAIENARLYEETRRRAQTIQTLNAVSHTVTSGRIVDDILQLIVNMTATLMGSRICSVMLLGDDGRELRIVATQSLSDIYRAKPPIRVDRSLSGQAVLTKKPFMVPDVRRDNRFSYPDIAVSEGLVSLLSVPMLSKDTVLGVINTYTAQEHAFSREDVDVLQAVANQCAAAIMQTRLLEEKLAAQTALETRKLVDRAKAELIKRRGLSEPEAFREIQKQSMDRRKSMKEIAEAILLAADLPGAG